MLPNWPQPQGPHEGFPPVEITLLWAKPDSEPRTFRLLFVDEKERARNRGAFNMGDGKSVPA
ncbi:hypothetical protein AB0P17_34740 [Streptomyces sp. NPDC088124]|uniref:hypothetical protein n=1 Tax=Streptomyces sp. NPDC088124 TaxID=3154654 RepID=UPI00341FD24E